MEEIAKSNSRERRGGAAPRALSSIGVLTAVTLILLIAPIAGARAVGGSLKPPYSGAGTAPNGYTSTSGCAVAKHARAAGWSSLTGVGRFSEYSNSTSCKSQVGNSGSSSTAGAGGGFLVSIPISFAGNGTYHIKILWTIHLVNTFFLAGGNCSLSNVMSYGCFSQAGESMAASAYLFDSTNQTRTWATGVCWQSSCIANGYWNSYNYTVNYTSCYSGTCSTHQNTYNYGGPGSFLLWYVNSTFVLRTTHSYILELSISESVFGDVGASGTVLTGAVASDALNGGTLGNYLKLSSVAWK